MMKVKKILTVAMILSLGLAPAGHAEEKPWPDSDHPLYTIARLQSDLERAAALGGEAPPPAAAGGLERLVHSYNAYLAGDNVTLAAELEAVAAAVAKHVASIGQYYQEQKRKRAFETYVSDLRALDGGQPGLGALVVAMRSVGGLLFMENNNWMGGFVETRVGDGRFTGSGPANDYWLRLPCRTVIGRSAEFERVRNTLGELTGPLLSCPSKHRDFARLERLARNPAAFQARAAEDVQAREKETAAPPAALPPQPWNRDMAVAHMGSDPKAADPVLERAAEKDSVGKLDYALFLYAFHSPGTARDARIAELTARIFADEGRTPPPWDGGEEPLIDIIERASSLGLAVTHPMFYAIPCDVLRARPGLNQALEPRYGGNRDNFIPRSGCLWGRGRIDGFPEVAFKDFLELSDQASGQFINNHGGSNRFSIAGNLQANQSVLRANPRGFLKKPPPPLDYPYQTWADLGPYNRNLGDRIRDSYRKLHTLVAGYYGGMGLNPQEAAHAAKVGLFGVVLGGECGGAIKKPSLRGMLMAKAPLDTFNRHLLAGDIIESPAVRECMRYADGEPMIHVATAHEDALALLLKRGRSANKRNSIGKTPLMTAVQYNRAGAARMLLSHGADVNVKIWGREAYAELSHDARTPLMYAAAGGSMELLRMLLDAGADPYAADTKGARAIHYLLGYGAEAKANPHLTESELSAASGLLF